MKTQAELISSIYDYILNTLQVQGRLLDKNILYGDGSRFNNDRELFNTTYNTIQQILIDNNLL